jgi:hypothetical protein
MLGKTKQMRLVGVHADDYYRISPCWVMNRQNYIFGGDEPNPANQDKMDLLDGIGLPLEAEVVIEF